MANYSNGSHEFTMGYDFIPLDELEKENRKLKSEIEDGEVNLAKYKEQLFLVNSNKEYDALNNEIDHLKKIISESEEKYILFEEEKETLLELKKSNEILVILKSSMVS